MTQKSNEEQLQLFDPTDYQDLDGHWNIEVPITEEELADLTKAAELTGMSTNEYVNYALQQALLKEGMN